MAQKLTSAKYTAKLYLEKKNNQITVMAYNDTFKQIDITIFFIDIQLGKGKARPKQLIEMNIDGMTETIYY